MHSLSPLNICVPSSILQQLGSLSRSLSTAHKARTLISATRRRCRRRRRRRRCVPRPRSRSRPRLRFDLDASCPRNVLRKIRKRDSIQVANDCITSYLDPLSFFFLRHLPPSTSSSSASSSSFNSLFLMFFDNEPSSLTMSAAPC